MKRLWIESSPFLIDSFDMANYTFRTEFLQVRSIERFVSTVQIPFGLVRTRRLLLELREQSAQMIRKKEKTLGATREIVQRLIRSSY